MKGLNYSGRRHHSKIRKMLHLFKWTKLAHDMPRILETSYSKPLTPLIIPSPPPPFPKTLSVSCMNLFYTVPLEPFSLSTLHVIMILSRL